ncbi:MAG: potassium transporter TrkG, partial [Bacteroides sp.]
MIYADLLSPSPTADVRGNSLINWKMIFRLLGSLLLFEAILFLLCGGVSLYYREPDYLVFLQVAALNVLAGGALQAIFHKADRHLTRRDAYCIVTFSWVLFSLSGMMPFLLSGSISRVADAFFETVSGFTTTGATILNDIESLSHG